MPSILFIWVMSQGTLRLETVGTFYTLEACQVAARNAENAPQAFRSREDVEVHAFCNTKRLNKDK